MSNDESRAAIDAKDFSLDLNKKWVMGIHIEKPRAIILHIITLKILLPIITTL